MASTNGRGSNGNEGAPPPEPRGLRITRRIPAAPRFAGKVASEAKLRARIELARVLGDSTEEGASARELALLLASHDVELDFAVDLAFRALKTKDDPELRHALAGWLEGLGEPGLAASELRKLTANANDPSIAGLLVRIGVLHARAGDAQGAQDAFAEASEMDEADALPLELLGAVAAWSQSFGAVMEIDGPSSLVAPRAGAEAYVRAARRRAAARDPDGEVENLLRAFELDPSSPLAAAALMGAYSVRERAAFADEVLRAHADALLAKGAEHEAAAVHTRRRSSALEAGQVGRAIGAALDERLDATFEGPLADTFDDMLARASAFEPLAVRLEVRAEREKDRAAATRWADLGRLLSGPLAAGDLAAPVYARAVAADATNVDALHALRAHAQKTGDPSWLVEGLIRGAMGTRAYGGSDDTASRITAARELAAFAEEKNDAPLAAWANGVIAQLDWDDERARSAGSRLESALSRHDEEIALARRALETSDGAGRTATLAELVRLLRSSPESSKELEQVLFELADANPDDEAVLGEALRVAERVADFAKISEVARARLSTTAKSGGTHVKIRGALVAALRRSGDFTAAAEAARAFAEDAATRWTCSVAWITAAAAGDRATRARALAAVAPACARDVSVTLSATAAEELARVNEIDAARRAAEQACRTDSQHPRALRVLATVANPKEGRVAIAAIERAIELSGPTAQLCSRLADVLEQQGDAKSSLAWARRQVAMRPGDPATAQALVDRAVRVESAEALGDALTWLLPQPQPGREMAERIAPALTVLAERDPARATALARRALDVLGPRHAALRSAIQRVATMAGDAALKAKLGERWIAAGAPAAECGPLLLALTHLYADTGDVERETRAFARAARSGVDLTAHTDRINELASAAKSPEAQLSWLEARAELRLDEGKTAEAAGAFRELGAALWDMADDRPRAVQAWLRAAHCDSAAGYATLRLDLASFADAQYAVDCLSELVERESDKVRSGVIATQASRAAIEVGAYSRALGLAKLALERDPTRAEALETAEHACQQLARVPDMSGIYDQVARRSLGRFGRRAAHHRAARFFETGGVAMLALKHAAQAFIAVPSEGTTLGLLQRTAEKAQRQGIAVRTVEHVAELARSQHARAVWLLRAASMTARDLDGTRQKTELLLKAAVLLPSPTTLGMLAASAHEVVSLAPEDAEAVALRLERASDQLAKGLEGPDGSRIAITFAEMALDLFRDGGWGWRSLERAIGADADVDEYVKLVPHVATLALADGAKEALDRTMAEVEKPYSNVGHALLRLVGSIAQALGDDAKRARALVRAAEKESDDDELVVEADRALVAHPDAALVERFNRRVGVERRTEALRAVAKKFVSDGRAEMAVLVLERAQEITPAETKEEVGKELGEALVAAGRGEDAVLRELARPNTEAKDRAPRWAELARIREERNDPAGAADALLQAATDDPTFDRWAAVERVAETAAREDIRVEALQHLVQLAPGEERLHILKRLARAEGARGSLAAAETAWREVIDVDPTDGEADVAIEALLVARGSYEDLAQHLARRVDRLAQSTSPDPDKLRAVRLRRAAILEQRLGRIEDACAELELVLKDSPNHPSALRWIADLYERMGEPRKALPALGKLFAGANEEVEYISLGVRRAKALLGSGDLGGAQQAIKDLVKRAPMAIAVAEARVDVARAAQDPGELGNALAELARISVEEPRVRSEMLVEGAQAAARAADSETSLYRAREAARLAPDVASTQLFARGLEYRIRGAGTKEEAKQTIASLERLTTTNVGLEPEDLALRAFLLAEAEDVAIAPLAGEKTLKEALKQIGAQPLIALGLAERAAAAGRHDEAYRFYIEAVYGNLLGLRRAGRVALAAADSAQKAGDLAATQRFLNEAAKDSETRQEALRRVAELAVAQNDLARARTVLRSLADALTGAERAQVLSELGRALLESEVAADRIEGDRTMREAVEHAPPELKEKLKTELEKFRARAPKPSSSSMPAVKPTPPKPPPLPKLRPKPPEPPKEEPVAHEIDPGRLSIEIPQIPKVPPPPPNVLIAVTPEEEVLASVRHPPLGSERPPAPPVHHTPQPARLALSKPPSSSPIVAAEPVPEGEVAQARALANQGKQEEAEKLLSDAMRDGSIEAVDALDAMIAVEPSRRGALLKVRRQAVELLPGNVDRLRALREAAKADQNTNYVRAIEHVLRAFDREKGKLDPPPLSAQNAQPGIFTILTRHSREPAGEALGVLWEGSPTVFAKPPGHYGMTGLERVVPGPSSALARLYDVALRLLESHRFALFHRRGAGSIKGKDIGLEDEGEPLALTVALLTSPAAILSGDAREDGSDLRWVLGQALSCVLPQNALVLGLPHEEAKAVWDCIVGAFGPPGRGKLERKTAMLAETLWQTLSPRAQRRLKELLDTPEMEDANFELVLERAKQSGRRVGMFLSGDFEHAAKTTLVELGVDQEELTRPGGLERLCGELPALADLYRLAVRPEYADARWHLPTPASQRLSAGKLP